MIWQLANFDHWIKRFNIQARSRERWKSVLEIFQEQMVDGKLMSMTVRQVFYQFEVKGLVPKTETGYRQTQYVLRTMRQLDAIPYEWIVDHTRWVRKPQTYDSLADMLQASQYLYRRALLEAQDAYIEVWLEKSALAGVFYDITAEYDIPLYTANGQSSDTFCYESAQSLKRHQERKPVFVYYFSDFDKSGKSAAKAVRRKLKEHGATFEFIDAALTEEQIHAWNVPTRPPKKGDQRQFAAELDAIPPNILRQLIRGTLEKHIDRGELARLKHIEQVERDNLRDIILNFGTSPKTQGDVA